MSDTYGFDDFGGGDPSMFMGQDYANDLNQQFDASQIDPTTGLPYQFNGLQNQTSSQIPPVPPGMGAGTLQDSTQAGSQQPYSGSKSSVLKNVPGVVDALMKGQQKSAGGGMHMGSGGELQGNLPGTPLAPQPAAPQATGYQAVPNRQPYGIAAGTPQIPF